MSARQNKKRKGRNHVNNRERTVTTFTEDPNTSFLVPLSSEEPPAVLSSPFSSSFSMPYQNYIPPQQQQFYPPALPPGNTDLEILENLKTIIKDGQHEFFRAVPQPAALASLYIGHIPQGQAQPHDFSGPHSAQDHSVDNSSAFDATSPSANNTTELHSPLSGADTSPPKLGADAPNGASSNATPSVHPDPEDITGPAADTKTDTMGEYGAQQPVDTASSDKATPFGGPKDDEPSAENTWDAIDDRKARYDDLNANMPSRASTFDSRPPNGTPTSDPRFPPEDRRFHDKDRDRDRDRPTDRDRDWDRDRDRHDSFRDTRDRDRDRRPEFFGRSYGRSHAPRPPPELRHYEPSYGVDYVPPRRYDPDDRRGGPRSASFDDRFKPPPSEDRRPPPPVADDRRSTLDDRPLRPLPGSDTRAPPPTSEDRNRPVGDPIPLARATAEDNRGTRATSLISDDRPRANVTLEERLSQPASAPSLQDRLSQPGPPARVDISSAPSLEERLTLGPVSRVYARAPSVVRDDHRAPLSKDDPRDRDRITDFRTNRDLSRERPGGPLHTATSYRPDPDRGFGDRDDRDRRDRDVIDVDAPSARFGDTFRRPGLPRRYSPPPPMFDRDRERGRARYPTRSPPPFRGEGIYDPDGERRYPIDRERDTYEQRRRDWYPPGDDDRRGPVPPPPASWRLNESLPFMDRDRERFDRERERDRDVRDRDRERDRNLGGSVPPPPRGHWEDRDRRAGFPPSPPPSRIDSTGGVGPGRSLGARLTDPYPGGGGDERTYVPPPPREFDRGRYGAPALNDHAHLPPTFSRVRNRSPSPPRRGLSLAEDLRPPVKRMREDNGPGYLVGGGTTYSPPRRGIGGPGEYAPGPPPSSAATTTSVATSINTTVPSRSTGTRTPPVSAPPPSTGASSVFYERSGVGDRERDQRDRERERDQREREREREYVRGEYGMGYDRDGRGRRSPPPLLSSRMGSGPGVGGGGYGRGVVGDRRDDRRYIPPPRTS